MGNYLLYAIGEIILVVIGILIALTINNANEYKKERAEEQVLRRACCARGGVEDRGWPGGRIAHPVEIAIRWVFGDRSHQVAFVVHWQFGDVFQSANIARLDPFRAPKALIERDLPAAFHQAFELRVLKRKQLVPAHRAIARKESIADRIISKYLRSIEGFEVSRVRHALRVK